MNDNDNKFSRRRFLSSSLSCVAAAGLIGIDSGRLLAQQEETGKEQEKQVIYRQLGRTGIKVPIISMGVGAVSSPGIIQAAYEAGVRHFDTAANYQYGRNEQMVGNVLTKLGVRDQAIIGTKIMVRPQREGLDAAQLMERVNSLLDGSLRRLKTDHVEILYVHDVSSAADMNQPGLAEAMSAVKEQGRVKAIGTRHFSSALVRS
jgi:aryl-alcohol dehydrogenase-like predicted oxidoreductase